MDRAIFHRESKRHYTAPSGRLVSTIPSTDDAVVFDRAAVERDCATGKDAATTCVASQGAATTGINDTIRHFTMS